MTLPLELNCIKVELLEKPPFHIRKGCSRKLSMWKSSFLDKASHAIISPQIRKLPHGDVPGIRAHGWHHLLHGHRLPHQSGGPFIDHLRTAGIVSGTGDMHPRMVWPGGETQLL